MNNYLRKKRILRSHIDIVLKDLDKIHIQMSIVPILFFPYILIISFVWLSYSTVNVVVITLELKERNLIGLNKRTARPKTPLILQELRLLDNIVILFTVTLMPCMQNICY